MGQQLDLMGGAAEPETVVWVDELFVSGPEATAQARRHGERNGHQWCHMWSTPTRSGLTALHRMAERIGLLRAWFQDREGFPHYDLTPGKRQVALRSGAVERSLREWLKEQASNCKPQASGNIEHSTSNIEH